MIASLMLVAASLGTTVDLQQPATTTTHLPLDLTGVMNADPWDANTMAVPGLPIAETPFVFIEGESVFRAEGAESIALTAASGEIALRGLGGADDWAEWAFDIPFDTNDAVLYLRLSRPMGEGEEIVDGFRPYTILAADLNGRPRGVLYANAVDDPEEFQDGAVRLDLGRVRMGRHLLRLSVRVPGEPVLLDCIWLGARTLDLWNERDASDRMMRPFSISVLAYSPGRIESGGIPFDLVDPRANDDRGVILPPEEGVMLPLVGKVGTALLLLGAGSDATARGTVVITYATGDSETVEVRWPALYDRNPAVGDEITVPLGLFRRAWVRRVPLRAEPLASMEVVPAGGSRLVLLSGTLEYRDTE